MEITETKFGKFNLVTVNKKYALIVFPRGHAKEVDYFNKIAFKGCGRVMTLPTFEDFVEGESWGSIENSAHHIMYVFGISQVIVWCGRVEIGCGEKSTVFISSERVTGADSEFRNLLDFECSNFGESSDHTGYHKKPI